MNNILENLQDIEGLLNNCRFYLSYVGNSSLIAAESALMHKNIEPYRLDDLRFCSERIRANAISVLIELHEMTTDIPNE